MRPPFPVFTKSFHSSVYATIDPTKASLSATGKVVLVTGGSKGIGKAIATAFAIAGARALVIIGRTESSLKRASREILDAALNSGHDTSVKSFVLDITDFSAVMSTFQRIRQEVGAVDVLVSNAGELHLDTIEGASVDSYWKAFEINVKGMLHCLQAFSRFAMNKESSNPTTLINVSTMGVAMAPIPSWSSYTASKLAAWSIVEHLRLEMGPNLRVFSIYPGRIATDMAQKAGIPTADNQELPGAFCVWLVGTPRADFLQGRLVACNWDVDELLQREDEIVGKNLLRMTLNGWAQL